MKLSYILASALMAGTLTGIAETGSLRKLSPEARTLQSAVRARKTPMPLNPADTCKTKSRTNLRVFIALNSESDRSRLDSIQGLSIHGSYGKTVTASIPASALESLAKLDFIEYIQTGSAVELRNNYSRKTFGVDEVHSNSSNSLPTPYTGKGVVVGVIDTGVEYAHPAFGGISDLRIRRIWEQGYQSDSPPQQFGYGTEFSSPESILKTTTDSQNEFHGCHTLGIAAGGDRKSKYYGMAPDADIVYVSFGDDNTYIADAIKYIFDYADSVNKPCVINMSLGSHHGPHDGSSMLDKIIDDLSGPGRIIVGACGNEGEVRLHASKNFEVGDTVLKTLLTLNSDVTHKRHYIDIWGTPGSDFKVNLSVANALKGQILSRSKVYDTANDNGVVAYVTNQSSEGIDYTATISGEISPWNNAPHAWIESGLSGTPATGKMIALEIIGKPGSSVHLWNEGLHEFSSNGKNGWTDGSSDYTVGEIGGTANRIITVGSCDGNDRINWIDGTYSLMSEAVPAFRQGLHSSFSSFGPTADGRIAPHILAPGSPVISALNRHAYPSEYLASNTSQMVSDESGRKYYYIYNMGTSMSAPMVAGTVALMLEANPMLSPEDARELLMKSASASEEMGQLPNNTYGAGNINVLKCLQMTVNNTPAHINAVESPEGFKIWTSGKTINVSTPGVEGQVRLELFSPDGAKLFETITNSSFESFDASPWANGIVIATLASDKSIKTFKIAL